MVDGGFISTCNVGGFRREDFKVSYLLFANDALVFVKDDQNQLTFLSWLLMWFEALSGLKINLEKSELILIGRVEGMELLAVEFGCKVGRLPSTYLGLPLVARYKSVKSLGRCGGEVQKEIGFVEESIYFQRGLCHID